jgi:hypothetical protein
MAKQQVKEADKKTTAAKPSSLMKDTVEVLETADQHPTGFPEPSLEDLMVNEIKNSSMRANRNKAKLLELESQQELEQLKSGTKTGIVAPMWGMGTPQTTRNPILEMVQMLPEEERAGFIKEQSRDLMGAMVPGNQFLQRLSNTGGDKPAGMGEMAQMMLAMTTASSEQQRNMLELWMTMQQMAQPKQSPDNNGNREMIQAMMAMTQAIVASNSQSNNAAMERMEKVYTEKAQAEKEYYNHLMEIQKDALERQLQFMQQQTQRQSGGLSKDDLIATLNGFKEATGVELSAAKNLDAEAARYEFSLRQKQMELEQERYNRESEERMMANQAEAAKWQALSGLGSALVDGMRLKKKMGSDEGAGKKLRSVIS